MSLLNAIIVCSLIQLTPGQPTYKDNAQDSSSVCDQRLDAIEESLKTMRSDVVRLQSAVSAMSDVFGCPADFISTPGSHCYRIVVQNKTWTEAARRCKSFNAKAHLAIIDSAAEQADIVAVISNDAVATSSCSVGPGFGGTFWIGAQRIDPATNSTFVWRVLSSDGTESYMRLMNFTNWRPGEPNYYHSKQACGVLVHSASSRWSYLWDDVPCSDTVCSVCEYDMNTLP